MSNLPVTLGNVEVEMMTSKSYAHFVQNGRGLVSWSKNHFFNAILAEESLTTSFGSQLDQMPISPETSSGFNSSTSWVVFAEDITDGSMNIVRCEPALSIESPFGLSPIPMPLSVYSSDASGSKGRVFMKYFGFEENPLDWPDGVASQQAVALLQSQGLNEFSNYLSGKGIDAKSYFNTAQVTAIMGPDPVQTVNHAAIFISQFDIFDIDQSHSFAQEANSQLNHPLYGAVGHKSIAQTHCNQCGETRNFVPVNVRDRMGLFVSGVKMCLVCKTRRRF